jgi:hypothetical protein
MTQNKSDLLCLGFVLGLLLILAASCKVTKYVEREKIVVDSSVVIQNEGLQRTLQETIENYEREREQWEKTGVVFETTPCPEDSLKLSPPTKIKFNDKGKIKSIESSKIKSIDQSRFQSEVEKSELQNRVDSLRMALEHKEIALSKTATTVTKEKKSKPAWPWWLAVVGAVIGWIGRGYWPGIRLRVFG